MKNILIVEDEPTFRVMLKTFLTKNNFQAETVGSAREALRKLKTDHFHLIIIDYRLPDKNGLELLEEVKGLVDIPVIFITNFIDIKTAVRAIKMGAIDYVTKPVNTDELLELIGRALSHTPVIPEIKEEGTTVGFLTTESDASRKTGELIELVAPTNMSVIIAGESGTGKEYVARKIHDRSLRSKCPFIAIDCGALPKDLAESELFGHVKGAFTGALADKVGQFEYANKGTLFLDEVGNLSYDIQVKLLRAIQERVIRRVGSNKDIEVDVRIVAATNENFAEAMRSGKFREDLYYRLNEFKIELFPLRERGEDVRDFASHFLKQANKELGKQIKGFDVAVMDRFRLYSWPGNLRELKNIVKRATLLATTDYIQEKDLPDEVRNHQAVSYPLHNSSDLKLITEKSEKEMILTTLTKVNYNKSKAARLLNIDRKTLYNKLRQYNIPID